MHGNIRPDWSGQVAFIVGGGPSVLDQNLELLRGHKVIAINSSYAVVPWADVLFFADAGWWRINQNKVAGFQGRIISASSHVKHARFEVIKKAPPPGLVLDPRFVAMKRTSFSGSINLAVHYGVKGMILLGADGKANGQRTHHYDLTPKIKRWDLHRQELQGLVEPLNKLGIRVINASPGSVFPMWPVMTLEQAIAEFA